jgi:hypothetical protein
MGKATDFLKEDLPYKDTVNREIDNIERMARTLKTAIISFRHEEDDLDQEASKYFKKLKEIAGICHDLDKSSSNIMRVLTGR